MSAITAEMEMELESELAHEAHEHESEAHEHEFESHEHELEAHEHEAEAEAEAEMEQESFFNHLAAMADRGGRSQALRRIALSAAKQALRSYRSVAPAIEGEFESESSFEMEAEASPLRAEHANAMMEHMSHEAVTAESEQEAAEQFLPLIPLAAKVVLPMAAKLGAKVLPAIAKKVAPKIMKRVTPHLTRGVSQVAKTLFRSPTTRPLLRAVPHIAKRTVANLARVAARGRHISPRNAVRILAKQTARVLSNPRHAVTAFRRSRALDRRYHHAARRYTGRPIVRGRAWGWRGHRPWHWRRHPRYYWRTYGQAGGGAPHPVYGTAPATGTYVHPAAPAPHGYVPAAGTTCQCFRPVSCSACGR